MTEHKYFFLPLSAHSLRIGFAILLLAGLRFGSGHASAQMASTVQSDWTEFHKQNMQRWNGVESVLNVRNVGRLQNAFTKYTGAGVNAAPAIANGVVYVGSTGGNFNALNSTTGDTLWTYPVSSLYSSPAVANGIVYFGANYPNNAVYALDANSGTLIWTYVTGNEVESAPTLVNGVVYIGSDDGNLYALNANTGAKLWSYTTGGSIFSSPAVVNGVVYFGSHDHNVYALNSGHRN